MHFDKQDVIISGIDRTYARTETIWNCEQPRRPLKAHRLPARIRIKRSLSAALRCLADRLEQGTDGYRTDLPGAV